MSLFEKLNEVIVLVVMSKTSCGQSSCSVSGSRRHRHISHRYMGTACGCLSLPSLKFPYTHSLVASLHKPTVITITTFEVLDVPIPNRHVYLWS